MKIKKAAAKIWRARLRQPFKIATGAHSILENVLFEIELENGMKGYGEAPVATHITGETIRQTLQNLKKCSRQICGKNIFDYAEFYLGWKKLFKNNHCALAAAEMAVLDALTRKLGIPFWKCFGERPEILKTDLTIVIGTPDEAYSAAKRIDRLGIRILKIKIGKDHDLDLERVCSAAKVSPTSQIYLDANQGYSAAGALDFLKQLAVKNIHPQLIEQPVPKKDLKGLLEVSQKTSVIVCADESASSPEDVRKLVELGFKGAINIKFVKMGIRGAAHAVAIAKAAGLKLMMGVMMESPLATTAAAHFAAGLGGFDFIDLDSPYFMKDKITQGFTIGKGGIYNLKKVASGIGVYPRQDRKSLPLA